MAGGELFDIRAVVSQHESVADHNACAANAPNPLCNSRGARQNGRRPPIASSLESLEHTAIFAGAGISTLPPSNLRSGDQLVELLFSLLSNSRDVLMPKSAVESLATRLRSLRLELVLEILARHIEPALLVQIFGLLRDARPNFNHLALLRLRPKAILTSNQDLLFERGASLLGVTCENVYHLHGRCDEPDSIVALISQYVGGLSELACQLVQSCVADTDLIVMGYSGRDRDIMTELVKSRPRSVLWIRHPGSPLSLEFKTSARLLGARLRLIEADATAWLASRLGADECSQLGMHVTGPDPMTAGPPQEFGRSFADLSTGSRNLALARLAAHVGLDSEADDLYRQLLRMPDVDRSAAELGIGTLLSHLRRFDEARGHFHKVATTPGVSRPHRISALLGEIDALRGSSHAPDAHRALSELDDVLQRPSTEREWRAAGWAASHRAGIDRMDGRLRTSLRGYSRAEIAFRKARDINGLIETLTWRADCYRLQGRYQRSLREIESVADDAELYSHHSVAAWALFIKGQLLCVTGCQNDGLDSLRSAFDRFRASGNQQGVAWSLITVADFARSDDGKANPDLLDEADELITRDGHLAYARACLWLIRSDIARSLNRTETMSQLLETIRSHLALRTHFRKPPLHLALNADLIEAEAMLGSRTDEGVQRLRQVRDDATRAGFTALSARASVSIALVRPEEVCPHKLLEYCTKLSFHYEVERLTSPHIGYYPLRGIG